MKFYSEKTNTLYNTAEECTNAERELVAKELEAKEREEKLKKERKNRAEEIKLAREAYLKAQENYGNLVKAFIKDYGSYHTTLSVEDVPYVNSTLKEITKILSNF